MNGLLADLAAMIRNPRRWWHNATHARCPLCGQDVNVGRWHAHQTREHS